MLKLLHCAQSDPGAYSRGAESTFILEGGALRSAKASFTGLASSSCMHASKDCVPQNHFIPCLSWARGISLYTHPPEMDHTPLHFMSPSATSSHFFLWGAKSNWNPINVYFSLNICKSQKLM